MKGIGHSAKKQGPAHQPKVDVSQTESVDIRHSLLDLLQQYSEEDLNQSSVSNPSGPQVEIGYFQTLKANFRSTEEEIRK